MDQNGFLHDEPHHVTQHDRSMHYGHAGAVLWLTGLSAAGKPLPCMALECRLPALGYSCYVLDGDNVRKGLNADLDFSASDRSENIRRVGETAALFADAGLICIAALYRLTGTTVPQSAPGGKRLRPAEALPGGGISVRQAQEKLRKRIGYGLRIAYKQMREIEAEINRRRGEARNLRIRTVQASAEKRTSYS